MQPYDSMSQRGMSSIREITDAVRTVINEKNKEVSDDEVLSLIEDFVLHDQQTQWMPHQKKRDTIKNVFYGTRRDLDFLQRYAEEESISEIMVNGPDSIFIERNGMVEKVDVCFETTEQLEEVIRRIAAGVHREINELNPIVDARLADGSRVNAVYKNIALNGPILTIRKFPKKQFSMKQLIEKQFLTVEAADFLEILVAAGYNVFVSGGTSSGKTTLLNVLTDFIPKEERVIVIEDSAELQINGIENVVRMETRNANIQGKGAVTARDLIKASLRMRPDRIIVGEVRGEEVVDMVQAMNTRLD